MIMDEPERKVVGAIGVSGGCAAKIVNVLDGNEYPTEFLASTIKV